MPRLKHYPYLTAVQALFVLVKGGSRQSQNTLRALHIILQEGDVFAVNL